MDDCCATCGGSGVVEALEGDYICHRCEGSGREGSTLTAEAVRLRSALAAAKEEIRRLEVIARAAEADRIVRSIAERGGEYGPIDYHAEGGVTTCAFCDGCADGWDEKGFRHLDDCPWLAARRYVAGGE